MHGYNRLYWDLLLLTQRGCACMCGTYNDGVAACKTWLAVLHSILGVTAVWMFEQHHICACV